MPPYEDKGESRPIIGITMGDPSGIGAEVIVKALADHSLRERARFIVYGLHEQIAYAADAAELLPYWRRVPHEAALDTRGTVIVADFDEFSISPRAAKVASAEGGRASMRFLEEAMRDAWTGSIDALVTGPINKTAWQHAGYPYPGHTELLAQRFRSRRVTMMFVGGPLRVALASIHVPLFELRHAFTIGLVFQPIDLLNDALRDWFGIASPRIGVAGLNPHAGEEGRFGDEELRVIRPAVEMATNAGIRASGPYPADTLFWRAAQGEFDGVVAMYHDQALIPVKLLAFDRAINVTLGLPIIRTSVDHGTAYDIVGRNKAEPGSMKAAIKLAVDLARQRIAAKGGAGHDIRHLLPPDGEE
ncbi:MAG TPA: 4-hydroxythreonine-4-phosphate dehydrogenase PdxA [Phycisphaerae bacterium]|nr:4-hydroxythreonine-4-phosphate dehydrogenase PdxA [Phycisphaerae bacterium]